MLTTRQPVLRRDGPKPFTPMDEKRVLTIADPPRAEAVPAAFVPPLVPPENLTR